MTCDRNGSTSWLIFKDVSNMDPLYLDMITIGCNNLLHISDQPSCHPFKDISNMDPNYISYLVFRHDYDWLQ